MKRLENGYTQTIQQMADQLIKQKTSEKTSKDESQFSFQEVLNNTAKQSINNTAGLKFSKHANSRLETRNINLSAEQIERLEEGTTKARAKGIQESLVMVDGMAFIVNIKNNTVVTAMDDTSDSVFTNIDGAVIN